MMREAACAAAWSGFMVLYYVNLIRSRCGALNRRTARMESVFDARLFLGHDANTSSWEASEVQGDVITAKAPAMALFFMELCRDQCPWAQGSCYGQPRKSKDAFMPEWQPQI